MYSKYGSYFQVINASGKLMMVQREEYDVDEDNNPVSGNDILFCTVVSVLIWMDGQANWTF